MKYKTGQEIRVGDLVTVENGSSGLVVCDFDNKENLEEYADWDSSVELTGVGDLSSGVLIKTEDFGLIHYADEDDTIVKIK